MARKTEGKMIMWEHRCTARSRKGNKRCRRQSRVAAWCHQFTIRPGDPGEVWTSADFGASWWETCTQHASRAAGIVSTCEVRPTEYPLPKDDLD